MYQFTHFRRICVESFPLSALRDSMNVFVRRVSRSKADLSVLIFPDDWPCSELLPK